MRVRSYKEEDHAAVVNLFQRSVREINVRDYSQSQVNAWAPEPPDLATWRKRLSDGLVLVCENSGIVTGFSRAEENGNIDLLYVHPEYQRQGIASALLKKILAWISARNAPRVFTEASLTARPLFAHFGFHVVRSQRVIRRGVEFENFLMERML